MTVIVKHFHFPVHNWETARFALDARLSQWPEAGSPTVAADSVDDPVGGLQVSLASRAHHNVLHVPPGQRLVRLRQPVWVSPHRASHRASR